MIATEKNRHGATENTEDLRIATETRRTHGGSTDRHGDAENSVRRAELQ